MNKVQLKKFCLAFLISLIFCSCSSSATKSVKDFGDDSNYFIALRSLSKNDYKDARQKLNKAVKKGTPLVARRSAETLCSFGDVQERVAAAKKLISLYSDDDALLLACRIFSESRESGYVLSAAKDVSITESNDALIALKLEAMNKRSIQGYDDDLKKWYLEKPFTQSHYKYLEYLGDFEEPLSFVAGFRADVYKRNYVSAYSKLDALEEICGEHSEYYTEQLMSDIGKTHLYGTRDIAGSARWFQEKAEAFSGQPMEFYCWFYAGRLYDKVTGYGSRASAAYKNAVESTDDIQKKDNARWYLLKDSLTESSARCIKIVKENLSEIGDPAYYDDFFDLLANRLISEGEYEEIGELYKIMKGHASREATAKFAYIYGRLLQEKICIPDDSILGELSLEEEIDAALKTALNSATDLYYKVQAAEHLGLSDYQIEKELCAPRKDFEKGFIKESAFRMNPDADRLLSGYAAFGFPEKIYSEWVSLGQCLVSEETVINICRLLQKCSDGRDDYYPQSLRIASRYANYSPVGSSREILSYCFPKCYNEFITKYAEKYDIEPEVLFALIRSESFFDSDVTSSAGAVGLSQLMTFTAEDVAKRLKKSDYDLTDPETNIEFGAWYLGNLISRLDGNYLDAFYSYNAGISRVRKWKQSSAFGFGLKNIPEDLFLETLPYTETREYGRKLVSATELYKFLYIKDKI
ncbi:MAG: lytic transglycosylase domain-containing protein [Treponema sp.]|nr:lytic transglycosylase domain-containing protein [Treponema sp.]